MPYAKGLTVHRRAKVDSPTLIFIKRRLQIEDAKWSPLAQHNTEYVNTSLSTETDNTLGIKGWDLAARKLGEVETDTMEKETYYLIHTSLPREIKELRSPICCSGHRMDRQICIQPQLGTRDHPSQGQRRKGLVRPQRRTAYWCEYRWKGPQADR